MGLVMSVWSRGWVSLVSWVEDWRYGEISRDAQLGLRGEQAAARMLRQKGLRVIEHGAADRRGEIDLIAIDRRDTGGPSVVFVEVKTLGTTKPGHPADRVDAEKQRRITQAALRFLSRQRMLNHRARFDVVAVWWPQQETLMPQRIKHYESAFEAVGSGQFYC